MPEHRLRAFESAGLLEPHRTDGGTRLYSDADLELIERIAELADRGINYAGIREILEITEVTQSEDSENGTPEDGTAEDEASDAKMEAQNKEEV